MYRFDINHDLKKPIKIKVIEKAWVAWIAAKVLKASDVAIVFGTYICLFGATKQDLILNTSWLRHEVRHVRQWKKFNYLFFPFAYLWYSLKYGYHANVFEEDARAAVSDVSVMNNVIIL